MKKNIILSALLVLIFQTGAGLAAVPQTNQEIAATPAADTGCYRILFDETHGITSDLITGQYTISDAFSQLATYLRGQGHIVEALQDPDVLNAATLDRFDVLVIVLPTEFYTVNEKTDIANFLIQGGRLVTIAENGQVPGDYRDIFNDLHTHLGDGVVHNKDVIEDPTNNFNGTARQPLIHTFSSSPVNNGVGTVLQLYASSLLVGSALDGTAFGDSDTTAVAVITAGSPTLPGFEEGVLPGDPRVQSSNQVNGPIVVQALAAVGSGDVFAIGDANLWDASDLDGNGKINLEEYDNTQLALNVFAFGQQCTKCRWALFKDKDPWPQVPVMSLTSNKQTALSSDQPNLLAADLIWIDPNEQILQNWDIPYTIFGSADIPSVDLGPYCKVIVASEQQLAFYQAISANRVWFESWINAGGFFEFHGATLLSENWATLPMPGGFSMSYYTTNDVTLNITEHALFKRPNVITPAELEDWDFSSHGYLVDLPEDSLDLVIHNDADQPAAAKFDLGQGCVLATEQTLEWAWDHEYSRLLENYIHYDDCSANFQLFFSLAVNSSP